MNIYDSGSQSNERPTDEGEALGDDPEASRKSPPIFNLPGVILFLIALLVFVHVVRVFALNGEADFLLVMGLAFIPASYGSLAAVLPFPNSGYWSPVTYGLLHGDWLHLGINCLWMMAFATPVARRFGWKRFVALTIAASLGGAAMHYLFYMNDIVPVIGASGAVSGHMGAACRFVFNAPRRPGQSGLDHTAPALDILQSFTSRSFLAFFSIWMVVNALAGSGFVSFGDAGSEIAWQAHIGGFLAGFVLFSIFERSRLAEKAF